MSSIQYYITLDLKRDYHQVLVMKEGDINSREIIVTIIDNGQPFDITNHLVKFKWHKSDHTYIFNDCNITENGKALINCTEQMLIVGGIAKVEVILYDDSDAKTVLSTMEFDVSIRNSVISNTDIESTDEFGALNNLILSNKDLNESLKQLEVDVEDAENIRISNENERISNETNRISAESQRQTDTATAITNATTATTNANTATENANNATDAANTATTNANNTTKKANTAIEKMEALMKDDNIIHSDDLGAAGGVATLDENGNIPASQLPSYVDDVLEGHAVETSLNAAGNAMCASGFILKDETEECSPESGKIYVDIETNLQYRWTGSIYISTGSVLELGTTSSTAFPGNRGLSLENRVTDIEEYHHNIPAKDIKFDNKETSLLGANVQNVLEELSKEATPVSKGLLSAEDKKRIDNYANDIGALAVDGDSKDNTVSFTSHDDLSPTQFNYVPPLSSGEKHSSLFSKISTMFKNIRWLYNILGATDISVIGNGTITGAISALNNNLSNFIKHNYISLPTTTIEPNSFREVEYNFSVPDGYKLLNSSIGHTGNEEIYPFGVQWNKDIGDITIYYYFKNIYPYERTVSPFVIITLVKNI